MEKGTTKTQEYEIRGISILDSPPDIRKIIVKAEIISDVQNSETEREIVYTLEIYGSKIPSRLLIKKEGDKVFKRRKVYHDSFTDANSEFLKFRFTDKEIEGSQSDLDSDEIDLFF